MVASIFDLGSSTGSKSAPPSWRSTNSSSIRCDSQFQISECSLHVRPVGVLGERPPIRKYGRRTSGNCQLVTRSQQLAARSQQGEASSEQREAEAYPLPFPAPCPLLPAFNTRDRCHIQATTGMLLYLSSRRNPRAWQSNQKGIPSAFFYFFIFLAISTDFLQSRKWQWYQ